MFETLLSFVLATAVLAISPGPDNIYVLTQSLVNGKKYGIATVCGLISGCIVHTTLLAFGASAIIAESETIYFIIKVFGALYLLFLAYKVYKSDAEILLGDTVEKKSTLQLFKQGFIMNVLNPKVTIFFLAFFPAFLFSNSTSKVVQFYVLGFLFMLTSFLIFTILAILASKLSNLLKHNKKISYYLKWMQIVVFIGISIFIFFS